MTTIHATFARRGSRLTMLASTVLTLGMTAVQAQEVTLDFWDQIWGPPEYVETAQRLVDQWNAEHPDVQVVYRSVPWTGWYETYVTAIASGSAPDISTGAGFQAVQFYDVGEILPVDDVVAALGEDPFTPGALDAVTYDGHVVALPWNIDIRAIYYRRDLLEAAGIEPPTTWEEFRTAAKALTGEGVYGLVSAGDSAGLQWMPTLMLNNGGGLFDAEGKPSLTGERSMEALEFLGDLVADGSVDPSSAGYTQDDARGAFCRGEAAFILDAPGLEAQCGEAGDQVAVLRADRVPNWRYRDALLGQQHHGLQPDRAPGGDDGLPPVVVGEPAAALD